MRRRVLWPLLLLGLIAVIAVIVPVGLAIADSRTQALSLQRAAALEQIAQRARTALVQHDTRALQDYLTRFSATYGEPVLVLDEQDDVVAGAGDLRAEGEVLSLARTAARSLPQRSLNTITPWSAPNALVAVPVITSGDVPAGVVVLDVDVTAARADVLRGWAVVGGIGALLLAALLSASLWWTQWILRPVRALDSAVAAVTEHRGPPPLRPTGPPELRRLSSAFSAMAQEVENSLERQRGFVADASHQLRNPLAAIRLRIDGLPRTAATSDDVEAVEADLDRLEHTVERMLVLADAEHRASARAHGHDAGAAEGASRSCTVSAAELVERHRSRLDAAGVTIVAAPTPQVTVRCGRADLDEMIDVLLDNAGKYAGRGAQVTVRVAGSDANVTVSVEDSGTGASDDDLERMGTRFWRAGTPGSPQGTGLGLAIVAQLMVAASGRLTLARAPQGGLGAYLEWGE